LRRIPARTEASPHQSGLPDRVDKTGHLLEEWIHFEKAIVNGFAIFIDDYLRHAKSLIDRIEKRLQS
jgi:hypothetical protein